MRFIQKKNITFLDLDKFELLRESDFFGSEVSQRRKLFNHLTMKRHVRRQDNKQLSELMSSTMN